MADTLQFELVSPERRLASAEARSVVVPGQTGELTAMPGHSPFFCTLRPGYVVVDDGSGGKFFVTGGFAEISPEGLSVLAEQAVEASEVTDDWLSERITEAERALEEAGEERRTQLAMVVNDFKALAGKA